jgi:hypothetical protein
MTNDRGLRLMQPGGKLRAWIETKGGTVCAAFVGVPNGATHQHLSRPPATRSCTSSDEARRWIEAEAAALGLPIEWGSGFE